MNQPSDKIAAPSGHPSVTSSLSGRPGREDDRLLTDDELVARVLAGDTAVFEILMRRHNQTLFRATRAILRSDDEAEDVMQHAYLRALEHLGEYEGRARFSTWLTRIAVYEALGRLRRQRRLEQLSDHDIDTEDSMAVKPPTPEQRASDAELRTITEAAIDALPQDFRVVFVLRAVEQMSVAEVSECLEIPQETVKTRFFRARQRLRLSLIEQLDSAAQSAYEFHLLRCDRVVTRVFETLGPPPEERR
jgi:RNA polymerase sigma-70 factor (ECF subfamily)